MDSVTTTAEEQNVKAAQRIWDEVWAQGNFDVMSELFALDVVRHDPNGNELRGREQTEQFIRKMRGAFPGLRYTIEDVIAKDDKVVTRYHFEGTHTGDALGFPATGKSVRYSGILIQRFEGGKLIEQWTEFDMVTMFQQLGVIPKIG